MAASSEKKRETRAKAFPTACVSIEREISFVTGPKGIWVWDPQGHHIGTIAMPEQPANLAWGGVHYDTLYITATHSVYKLHTKTKGFVPYLTHGK